jgi:uncharacterized coiled-coil DUF342 family protein
MKKYLFLFGICLFVALPMQMRANNASRAVGEVLMPAMAGASASSMLIASSSVSKLTSDESTLHKTLDVYLDKSQAVHQDLHLIINVLTTIDKVTKALVALNDMLGTVNDLLAIPRAIPQTRETAENLSKGIAAIKPQVEQASTKMTTLNNKVQPINARLQSFDSKLQKFIAALQVSEKSLDSYVAAINTAQQCVLSLPSGSARDKAQNDLDKLSDKSDGAVVNANTLLAAPLNAVKRIEDEIIAKLQTLVDPLDQLDQDVESLLSKLRGAVNPLHDLSALFNKSFGFSFPYPNPTWRKPWRISHYTISVEFKTIINGADAIEKRIEQLLSGTMYRFAKEFGLGKIVDGIENDAKHELNTITNRMNLGFPVSLPGLNRLDESISRLSAAFGDLDGLLDFDPQPITSELQKIQNDISAFQNICR